MKGGQAADGAETDCRARGRCSSAPTRSSPLDVIWHRQSKDLGAKLEAICGKIKNDDDRREAVSLARMFLSARQNAQRCAVDCAPYVHAKLQAVHHEHGPTGRYIIADRPLTEAEWIKAHATVIDVTPKSEGARSLEPDRAVNLAATSPARGQGRPAHGSLPCRVQSEYRACSRRVSPEK